MTVLVSREYLYYAVVIRYDDISIRYVLRTTQQIPECYTETFSVQRVQIRHLQEAG